VIHVDVASSHVTQISRCLFGSVKHGRLESDEFAVDPHPTDGAVELAG